MAMIINRFRKMENKPEMHIDNKKITSEHSVKLLGIEIDNQLKFDNHISTLCRKAGSQLNAGLFSGKLAATVFNNKIELFQKVEGQGPGFFWY